jgi:hypothetical protein
MLALQTLTTVPFRCVDEINQVFICNVFVFLRRTGVFKEMWKNKIYTGGKEYDQIFIHDWLIKLLPNHQYLVFHSHISLRRSYLTTDLYFN